ncbi:hypothetical protein K4F52_008419 [Lecanicillium sp. MT-2017a]|nr:hypothetical protein K4F52_008419 [Lecanicillium sp. MT-2017a]
MGLRDMVKKKEELQEKTPDAEQTIRAIGGPEFTFIRSDTSSVEVLQPPAGSTGHSSPCNTDDGHHLAPGRESHGLRRSLDVFRSSRSRSASLSSQASHQSTGSGGGGGGGGAQRRRLSQRLHLSHRQESSDKVPENLPEIVTTADPTDKDGMELQWEKRATLLAGQNELALSRPSSPSPAPADAMAGMSLGDSMPRGGSPAGGGGGSRSRSPSVNQPTSSAAIDLDIQEAIRLHEEGDLESSTRIFGRLANPEGANNPLSQVLYGLALRHGWGCAPDTEQAVKYLSAAASNAASVEQLALQAGLKKGGAAKGELVLAIFELANCFRHGWGIPKDAVAAKQYYETAANLGDTDAMNEAAWCYLEGFGCKKDKFAAARYYRLAETNGNKTLGNSWIWKEKYDPDQGKDKKKKK